ncbi:MAG: threonine/serine dehydratase [Alphaproteobacteria bacterium]
MNGTIDLGQLNDAAHRLSPYLRRTPTIRLPQGSLGCDFHIDLKLEHMQVSGSFKARGAFNAALSNDIPSTGLIAASGGNHGAAVAAAARALGHKAEIFVPTISNPAKIAVLRDLGAILNVGGDNYAEALIACNERQAQTGAMSIHAFNQHEVLAGQGTLGLEWMDQSPDLTRMLIAVGGGGLIAGVAAAVHANARDIKIDAVEPETSCCYKKAIEFGAPTTTQVSGIAADALGASQIGDMAFEILRRQTVDPSLVSDKSIKNAQESLWKELRLAVEPAAATSLAALQSGVIKPKTHEVVGILICGANVDLATTKFT